MPATRKIMGVGRKTVKNIVGSTTFAGLTDVDVAGSQQGTVLFYNGSKWVDLAPATANQVLTTNGAGANPSWTNKTSATGIVGGTDRMVQFNDGGSTFGGVAFFEFQKLTNNLMVSGSSGYSYSAKASGSSQTTSGLDVFNYDNDQVLQVGHNNATTESYIWATQASNNLKFGTNNTKRMEILASNGKIFTTNDFHVSGTLTAGTAALIATDSLWTQKGDLAVGTGSDTAQRLSSAAGDNGQVLTIDTGETTGLKWADPGGVEIIARYHVPVASASTGATGSRYVSSPIRIDPAGGDWEDGNVVITDDPGVGTVSTTGLGKLSLISQTGSSMLGVAASGAATTIAKFGSITNHTSTIQFLHNGYSDADILSKIVMTSGTTTIGAESPHKFILTGGLGITAQSTKPTDSTTKPAIWVSGTSNLLYLSDVGMVTANSSVLSAGYVPYVSGAAKNGVGNSVLYNDATNSRIGINTASPNRAFDVRGTSLLSGNTKVVGTGEITSTLDVGSNITGTGTATFKTASLTNIVLDPTTRAAFIKLQDSSRTTTTASRNPEILLNQVLVDSGSDKADFPTIRFTKGGPVAADASYTNLGYRIYVSGETGAGTVNAPQAMIWDFNSDIADPANYIEKLALTTTGGLRINNAYTLPTAVAGSNGYVITGNTDGTTGWAAQSGGGGVGGYWGLNGSKIHYTSGNVGIITNDPQAPLHVSGNVIFGSGASSVLDRVNIGDTTKGIYGYNNRLDFYISSNPRLHLDAGTLFSATSGGPSMDLTPGPAGTANYGFVDDTDTGMTRSAANTLHLLTAGVSGMTMDSSQNVGIGTTTPGKDLDVNGHFRCLNTGTIGHGGTNRTIFMANNEVNFYSDDATTPAQVHYQYRGGAFDVSRSTLHVQDYTANSSNPRVGIGTSSPGGKLDIVGSSGYVTQTPDGDAEELVIRNNHRAGISILSSDSASRGGYIVFGGATDSNAANIHHNFDAKTFSFQGQNPDMQLRFASANNVEAMRIDTSQNVGIGTVAPTADLAVRGDSSAGMASFVSGTGNGTYPVMHVIDSADTEVAWFEGNRAGDAYIGVRHWPASATENARSGVKFQSKDDGGALTNYATILMRVDDFTGGTEDGTLRFEVMADGTSTEMGRFYSAGFRVEDSKYLAAGTSSDLFLYHDGNSTIRNNTGI